MSDDEVGYEMILPFDTDDLEFVRGFEVGKVWTGLKVGDREFVVHHENAEMMLRIADALGMSVQSETLDDGYMDVVFS